MKLNDFENLILNLNKLVPEIDNSIIHWARMSALPATGVRYEDGTLFCIKCFNKMKISMNVDKLSCKHCETDLNIIDINHIRKSILPYSLYFCVTDVLGNIQLVRTFRISCKLNLNSGDVSFICKEFIRHWIGQNGETAVTAVPVIWGMFIDFGKLKLRFDNRVLYDYYADIATLYPQHRLTDQVRQLLSLYSIPLSNISSYSMIMEAIEQRRS